MPSCILHIKFSPVNVYDFSNMDSLKILIHKFDNNIVCLLCMFTCISQHELHENAYPHILQECFSRVSNCSTFNGKNADPHPLQINCLFYLCVCMCPIWCGFDENTDTSEEYGYFQELFCENFHNPNLCRLRIFSCHCVFIGFEMWTPWKSQIHTSHKYV